MPFAYLYIPTTKQYKIEKTNNILNFAEVEYDSNDEECRRRMYKCKLPKGRKQNCQVLKTRESRESLERATRGKRIMVPKLSTSRIYDNESSDHDSVTLERNRRKVEKSVQEKAKKVTNSSIIAAHVKARKIVTEDTPVVTVDKVGNAVQEKAKRVASCSIDNAQVKVRKIAAPIDIVRETREVSSSSEKSSDRSGDEISYHSDREEVNEQYNHHLEPTKEELMEKLKQERELMLHWQEKYNELKELEGYSLTEKTGKEIVEILKNLPKRDMEDWADQINSAENNKELKFGTIRDQKICIGNDIWMSKIIYDEINREIEPSKFITNASYAVWGVDTLSARCVRAQSNVKETELTPTKKSAILKIFDKWMKEKRMMPQHLIDEQMSRKKSNKYFNGAITAARKKSGYGNVKMSSALKTQTEIQVDENNDLMSQTVISKKRSLDHVPILDHSAVGIAPERLKRIKKSKAARNSRRSLQDDIRDE